MKDDLHIADAGMNSTYVSEVMCEFRGKLRAVIIKIILVRRVCSSMVCNFIDQFEKKVNSLKASVKRNSSMQTAGLKPVIGTLHSDSYYSVPDRVKFFCEKSLVDAFTNSGVNQSLLVEAFNNISTPKKDKNKKHQSSSTSSSSVAAIGPRVRHNSSRYSFLSHH